MGGVELDPVLVDELQDRRGDEGLGDAADAEVLVARWRLRAGGGRGAGGPGVCLVGFGDCEEGGRRRGGGAGRDCVEGLIACERQGESDRRGRDDGGDEEGRYGAAGATESGLARHAAQPRKPGLGEDCGKPYGEVWEATLRSAPQ